MIRSPAIARLAALTVSALAACLATGDATAGSGRGPLRAGGAGAAAAAAPAVLSPALGTALPAAPVAPSPARGTAPSGASGPGSAPTTRPGPPAASATPATSPASTPLPSSGLLEPARIVVLLDGGPIGPLLTAFQLLLVDSIVAKGLYLLETPVGITDTELSLLIAELEGEEGVVFAEPDRRGSANETESCDDGGGGSQGSPQQCTVAFVDGTPTVREYEQQPAKLQIRAWGAQRLPHPYTPVVAVIDTGIDPSHPVFRNALHSPGYDFVLGRPGGFERTNGLDDDGDGLVDEAFGHGTHVAGTVRLVDDRAEILPVRCLDTEGNGSGYRIAESVIYAVDAGADVINLSVSMQVVSLAVIASLQYAEALGVVVMTSAGNTGDEVLFPGSYDPFSVTWTLPILDDLELDGAPVFTVTAVDGRDRKADFAAWGGFVDLSAPGVSVYGPVPGGGYAWWSGTSMATAVASGAAALVMGIGGPFPLTEAGALLEEHADDISRQNPDYPDGLGAGRIDVLAAGLDALLPP